MEVNYEYLADCRIDIRIQPAGEGVKDAREERLRTGPGILAREEARDRKDPEPQMRV